MLVNVLMSSYLHMSEFVSHSVCRCAGGNLLIIVCSCGLPGGYSLPQRQEGESQIPSRCWLTWLQSLDTVAVLIYILSTSPDIICIIFL